MLKKNRFLKIYKFFVIFFFVLTVITWGVLWVFLKSYEDGRPEHTAEGVVNLYNNKKYDELLNYIKLDNSQYNTKNSLKEALINSINDKTFYTKKVGSFTKTKPVYLIKTSNSDVATLYLKKKNTKGLFGISRWEVDKIEPSLNKNDIKIIVPSNVNPILNGNLLDGSLLVNDNYYPSEVSIINNITPIVPYYVYELSGIYDGFKLEVSSGSLNKDENTYTYVYPENNDVLNGVKDNLISLCKNYTMYVGNEVGFNAISYQIMPNTDVYEMLRGISNTNRWSGYHTPTEFGEITFSNMEMYSDNAFKVEANYKYNYSSDIGYQEFDAKLTIYMVKENDTWFVVNLNT